MTWTYSELPLSKEMYEELEKEFMPKSDHYGHENDFTTEDIVDMLVKYVPGMQKPSDLPWGVAWAISTKTTKSIPKIVFKNKNRITKNLVSLA